MDPIEPLQPAELAEALACLLAAPGSRQPAAPRQVRTFLDYLAHSAIRWEGLRCGPRSAPSGLFLALLLPGATAIVLIPTPGELGIAADSQERLAAVGLERLKDHHLHYAQALLVPGADAQRSTLQQLGFQLLAPLVYLERAATYPWVEPPSATGAAWVKFSQHTYDDFAAALLATYQDSRDCPELTGLRPIDDTIAAHQASGLFDPDLWELLRLDGRIAACLLLARVPGPAVLEVVYMGVVASLRRRGVGSLLLRRALQRCRAVGAQRLTLVVDDRNEPAKCLYTRFALHPVARRQAYLYRWPASPCAAT